jgi:hypothetical protein
MRTTFGVFKEVHNGDGIYWDGTYNVEGVGSYSSIAEARQAIDDKRKRQQDRELAEKLARIDAGRAVKAERAGDTVTVFCNPPRTMTIREYRQRVFDMEDEFGKEIVVL